MSSLTFQDLFLYHSTYSPLIITCLTLALTFHFIFKLRSSPKIFLLDYSCYKPSITHSCTKEMFTKRLNRYVNDSKESLDFMVKTLERSGLGQSTYLSGALIKDPPNICLEGARDESETVMFGAVDELLAKTGVKGKDIRVVIVNCSLFNVVPSLCSMIVNRYNLGDDVLTYNLSGMGCSSGLAAVGLAKNLLKVHGECYALVVSTENITQSVYKGDDRSKLLTNCMFRVGGSAVLLSNRPADGRISKYRLVHTVHSNTARSDESFNCIFQEEDSLGIKGVNITRSLLTVANQTIRDNLTELGHLILPMSEKVRFLANQAIRYLRVEKIAPYIPDYKTAVDHVFIHVGGKPVLDVVEKSLRFGKADMEPSRMTLYRFGNTSSSSIWYGLAYAEAKGRIRKGDRAWQLAFGSGFKCSSVIWQAIRTVGFEESNPWSDEIDQFPVEVKVEHFPYAFKTVD